jgi:hypothetical protein
MANVLYKVRTPQGIMQVYAPEDATDDDIIGKVRRMRFSNEPQPIGDAAAGMSGTDRFLAGAGKSMTDLARGVGQLTGQVSQQDIDAAAEMDAPLMQSGMAKAGAITGKVATALPALGIPGVNTVAGSALLGGALASADPVRTGESRLRNAATGAALGGATTLALRAVPTVAKAIIDPFREGGRDQIAARTLERFAKGGTPTPAKTPGWNPTLAQATQDPGLAVLERGLGSASPDIAAALAARQAEQNAAAVGAIRTVAGTPAKRNMAEGVRSYMTEGVYEDAAKRGVDAQMAKALAPQIENLMARPSVKAAIKQAEAIMDENAVAMAKSGSVEGLQLLKQALDDMIEKAPVGSSIGKYQLKALQQTRGDLIGVMEQIAPKLREADRAYATFSRPVNEMAVGQALEQKLVPALMDGVATAPGRVKAQEYAAALRSLDDQVPKITGYPGATVENTLSMPNLRLLEGVRDDLAARATAQELARGVGSNTAQNLSTQNLVQQMLGPMGMPKSWAQNVAASTLGRTLMSPAGLVYRNSAEQALQSRLADALMDPALAQQLLTNANRSALSPTARAALSRALSAPVPGVVGARNTEQQ